MGLLTRPLAPVKGVIRPAEIIQKRAEQECYDPDLIRQELEDVAERIALLEQQPRAVEASEPQRSPSARKTPARKRAGSSAEMPAEEAGDEGDG